MSVLVTPGTMVWAAAGAGDKLYHALTGWVPAAEIDKVRLAIELANRQGNLKVQVVVRFCWDSEDEEIYGSSPPAYAVPQEIGPSADADGVVVDNTALSLPSTNRAALVQFGLLAWNDDTPYDDLSVGYALLKIEFLER